MKQPRAWPLLAGVIILAGLWLRFHGGAPAYDDAYISFRYARNLAAGHGLVYNIGERVMGASCPLWVLILAAAGALNFSIPAAAFWLSLLCDAAALILFAFLAARLNGWAAALIALTLFSLSPQAVSITAGGMETSLYLALILAMFLSLEADRPIPALTLVGLVTVTRPEGLLLALPVLWTLRHRRPRWHFLIAGLPLLSWLLFSALYYHSLLPQSVGAKMATVDARPEAWHNLGTMFRYAADPLQYPPERESEPWRLWVFGALVSAGLALLALRPKARPLLAWAALYALAFALPNRLMFWWYYAPLLPLAALAIGAAVSRISSLRPRWTMPATCCASAALAALLLPSTFLLIREREVAYRCRECLYAMAGRWLGHTGCKEAAIWEIGAFGWAFPGRVLDLNGLVSPQAITDPQATIHTRRTVTALRPDAVVLWLENVAIAGPTSLPREYRLVNRIPPAVPDWARGELRIYARNAP